MVLAKYEVEAALFEEKQAISSGKLKEDNPLDDSESFLSLCDACRRGDLKLCQEKIQEGVNINARDHFDYTPLTLVSLELGPPDETEIKVANESDKASLCGHFEVVQLLLESGALCERDTFEGERCLYNALNDKIRNLLLSYDYSKSRDPLQPLVGHITSLIYREAPQTSDITLTTETKFFRLHKFVLSARSPYFAKKLATAPETTTWRVPSFVPVRSLEICILALYFGEVKGTDLGATEEDRDVLAGVEKLSRQLEIGYIFEAILEQDRRLARQRRTDEVERGRDQLDDWFRKHVLAHKLRVDTDRAEQVKWDRQNTIFADVLLCADEEPESLPGGQNATSGTTTPTHRTFPNPFNGIPIGPLSSSSHSPPTSSPAKSTLIPAHRAMLVRSEYFAAMFASPFREAQETPHLPVIRVDCTPATLEVILTYLYTERATFPLDGAIDVLFAADQLFIEKLKIKAAMIISTLGNGGRAVVEREGRREAEVEVVDIYDVVRAGWDTRVHRLEEFGARYIAYRLERYIDEDEFRALVQESAARIKQRQETDTVELIDE